jgi:hypothetical protein
MNGWRVKMNFIHHELPKSDIKLFFGEDETAEEFNNFNTLADIVINLGKFSSITQARKNGWYKSIPSGFSEHKIGKTKFWTLNKWDGCDELL